MEIKTVFMIFGIALAVTAVVVSFIGLRSKDFPGRGGLIGLIIFSSVLVVGTATFAVELSVEEQEEREHGDEHITGEEASATPLKIPAQF